MPRFKALLQQHRKTKLVSVVIHSKDEVEEVFGSYTHSDETPIMCVLDYFGNSLACCKTLPENSFTVITHHFKFHKVEKAGCICLGCFYNVQFLVTKQTFVYGIIVKNCPTADNVMIEIDIAAVFQIPEEGVVNFCYKTTPEQLSLLLEATISERMRVLARSYTHLDTYSLKGSHHAHSMVNYLNEIFTPLGLKCLNVIIPQVLLPEDLALKLQEKTSYYAKNRMEVTKQKYDLKVIYDDQENELIKQNKAMERLKEQTVFEQKKGEIVKDHKKIIADTEKIVAELSQKKESKVLEIHANAELAAEEIRAMTRQIEAKIIAEGTSECEKLKAENEAILSIKEAEIVKAVAEKKAEAARIEGETEQKISDMIARKRTYDIKMKKLSILNALASNPNLAIYGKQNDTMITQMAAFRLIDKDNMN